MKKQIQISREIGKSIAVLALLLFLFSCQEFIELETPNHLLTGETVFEDKKTVEAAITDVYAQLRSEALLTGAQQGLSNLMGNYADEIDFYGNNNLPEDRFYKNNLLASDQTITEIWNNSYSMIYSANAIIEGVNNSKSLTSDEVEQFSGEAKFLRALIHFYLYNLYGDIPYITSTDYIINQSVRRDSREEVYSKIITDLIYAKDHLNAVDMTGEQVRADSRTAKALLARLYMYSEDWGLAAEMASEVIAETVWETEIDNVFLKESPSILFQLMPQFEGLNTLEAQTFIFETAPPPARALSEDLFNAFEENDLRKTKWIGGVSDGTTTFYYPFKYKFRAGESTNFEYSIVLRLAEQYLIRAESRLYLGDMNGAIIDLNKIRERAGLSATLANTNVELLEAILQERRLELFTEHGHRFFDLKRLGKLDGMLGGVKPGWDSTDKLLPIPDKELNTNPNLKPQNPGY